MNKNKITALAMSVCISFSLMTSAVFAAETESKDLEKAILNIKSIISVSDDYKDFSYSSSQTYNDGELIDVWMLNWENEDKESIEAEIDSYGNLISYYNYDYNYDNTSSLAKVSREKAESIAEEFLKKAMPDYLSDMRIVKDRYNDSQGDEYYFTYQQYVNNIPVSFVKVNIGVNKYTGKVSFYTGITAGSKKIDYPEAQGVIDAESAKNKYIEKIQPDLSYYSSYDYKNKKYNTFAAYSIDTNRAIDAKTGENIGVYNSEEQLYRDKTSMIESAGDIRTDEGVNYLSESEQKEVNNVSGLITKEKAVNKLKENFELFSKVDPNNILINMQVSRGIYLWEVNFDEGYAAVDAKTGEVLTFYIYRLDKNKADTTITKEEAKSKADTLLNKIAGDKFNQTKLSNDSIQSNDYKYEFNYIRQVNQRDYKSNQLIAAIDKSTGDIIEYRNVWFDNISFPDISKAISKEDAFYKFNDSEDFGLYYALNEENKAVLVYDFPDTSIYYNIDAISGNKIDFNGNEYNSNELPEYNDISGHWCEKYVRELLDNGYYIKGDNFNPDKNITQINFLKYMFSSDASNYTEDEFYEMLIDRGIINKEERNALGAVTNRDAAKFITRYLGYDNLVKNHDIFKNPFKDSIDDDSLGYASICYGLNIIKGDSKGNFNGDKYITNARAALYIYNMTSQNRLV